MNGLPLEEIQQERDIGVVISNDLKPSKQCAEAARRASVVLGQVSRAFMYRDRITFLNYTLSLSDAIWNLLFQHGHPGRLQI